MKRSSVNVTTVALSPEDAPLFQEAAQFYRFGNLAAFFRTCGELLIDHYQNGDKLVSPLAFEFAKKGKKS